MLISGKKKIKCAAGLNNCFFFCFELRAGLCLSYFDSSVFRIYFTSRLYYSYVAPIFFVPAGLYYFDFCLISAVPTVRLNFYYLGSNIFGFELGLYIHASGLFLRYIFRHPVLTVFVPVLGYFSAFFVPSSIVFKGL